MYSVKHSETYKRSILFRLNVQRVRMNECEPVDYMPWWIPITSLWCRSAKGERRSFIVTKRLFAKTKESIDMRRPARARWSPPPVCLCPIDLCRYTKGSASLINVLDRTEAITRSTGLSTHVHTSPNYRSHSCTRIMEHGLCSDP